MKKAMSLALLLLLLYGMIIQASASTIKLNSHSLTLFKGKSAQLSIDGIKNSKVTWKTSNNKIVSVTKNGKIKAKNPGTATITGKYNSITFKCKVTVQKVKKCNTLLYSGEFGELYLKEINSKGFLIQYKNTTDKDIWISSLYFVLDGKQLESFSSDNVDPETNYNINYNDVGIIAPSGWSREQTLYLTNPSTKYKDFSGFLKVMEYEYSSGKDIGSIRFLNVNIQ